MKTEGRRPGAALPPFFQYCLQLSKGFMSTASFTIRDRIQAQSFCGLDDATYMQINYPLRLSPAICMVRVAGSKLLCRLNRSVGAVKMS